MKFGIMTGAVPDPDATIDSFIAQARDVEARGFASFWLANTRGHDAVTAMAMAGRETTTLEVGTAVTPVQPRHPSALAQQALTASALARGRFTLGIGLSHKVVIEDALGLSYAKPAKTMEEYLEILAPLLAGEDAAYKGDIYCSKYALGVKDAANPVPLIIAALGPMMLELAGRHSDGTCLWMTGARTIAQHVVPAIRDAAASAGRPAPRVIAGFPVVLTDDPDGTREKVNQILQVYGQLPSYRAMMDREGAASPGDIALVGDEAALDEAIAKIGDAGATEMISVLLDTEPGAKARTLDYLQGQL
ncbi:MAG: TIGR03564 family F420-dependent LLM class oxidoreductase [Rhodospirillaceae bacterium]|jgi:5,10-methylenetetrahydromethanopterin reductase|nr:TIGR03564 family F420-dependent LLM class oxidoreductase [Rhodospirillaceae bacterium]MBT5195724.1 TIGR03564 family F420-dependent LLM class oxidoreductase [Rhodospirillaceae bacterium]MBT5896884.1 TIGR03564 family F420-dependent LLM class oxidoreductase [Rhodospirillaceae bacterium]MBT6431384.1 TIGR03564 family F420-dependent LLM class oxidoreductase [Rhodospirillaceae bacterium]